MAVVYNLYLLLFSPSRNTVLGNYQVTCVLTPPICQQESYQNMSALLMLNFEALLAIVWHIFWDGMPRVTRFEACAKNRQKTKVGKSFM